MGGFTQVFLNDASRKNNDRHNALLKLYNIPDIYRYYSEYNVIFEYESFKMGLGTFDERLFPKDKINNIEDFKQYWSTKALGDVFVPPYGTLQFDCYFGRTSKRAMRNMGRYIADNIKDIKCVSGSFETFAERGMTKLERQICTENRLI